MLIKCWRCFPPSYQHFQWSKYLFPSRCHFHYLLILSRFPFEYRPIYYYVLGQLECSINLRLPSLNTLSAGQQLRQILQPQAAPIVNPDKGPALLQAEGTQACRTTGRQPQILHRPLLPWPQRAPAVLPVMRWGSRGIGGTASLGQLVTSICVECSLGAIVGEPLEELLLDGLRTVEV